MLGIKNPAIDKLNYEREAREAHKKIGAKVRFYSLDYLLFPYLFAPLLALLAAVISFPLSFYSRHPLRQTSMIPYSN